MAGGYNYVGGGQDLGTIIYFVNEVARDVAQEYGFISKQVNARMACLLKNQYRLQVVLKISEGQYTMLKMTGEIDAMTEKINNRITVMPGMPRLQDPLEITWENPAFSSF